MEVGTLYVCANAARSASIAKMRELRARWLRYAAICTAAFLMLLTPLWMPRASAQTASGSISGTVKDPTGAVVPGASVSVRNTATGVAQSTTSNADGLYAFPSLSVGMYEVNVTAAGFSPYKRTGLVVDVNTKLQVDADLQLSSQSQQVTVTENAVQVETENTQMGDVVTGPVITAVGLNGRSYTDLLSLQPGIVPMSTQTGDSVVMAGVTTAITPSGNLNPGNQSINGQREDANGFLVNGSDVKELMNGGTAIIPDLDSISEFRVLTNNFDPEYGNYSGGIVNTVTANGTNQIHGDVFEFLRNTALDAKYFFSPSTDTFRQNQFGGTIGGPIKKDKIFFFGDYQGTRTEQAQETGRITVPSAAELQKGDFFDTAIPATATTPAIPPFNSFVNGVVTPSVVSGPGLANQLTSSLGYTVTPGEPYYTAGCTASTSCVFPNATIPSNAWTAPSRFLSQYIPAPNDGPTTFFGNANENLRDDKWSYRVDGNSIRLGNLSAYYFFDDYFLTNPFPSGQGGATIPGFQGLNHGRAQLISLGDTKTFGAATVNELHFSFMRSSNVVGQPSGGLGVSLESQGFNTNAKTGGILPLAPQFEGIENTVFQNQFVMGEPITNVDQANNTFAVSESLSRVIGGHTLKFGVEVNFEQVNVRPDAEFDGTFLFDGYETGNNFADFVIGAPAQFNQQDSESYYPRHKYAGWYGQDSWRIKPNLTLNYGLRMDLMQYWSEKYNQVPTFNPGEQSKVFPNAFPGLVYPTDPGIPNTLVPEKLRWAPRIGIAYSPSKSGGLLGKLLGGAGSTSIRAGYGILNTIIEGNTIGIDEPQPPFGLSGTVYNGLMQSPYYLVNGAQNPSPYPLPFVPYGATASNPNASVKYIGAYNPQSGMTAPPPWNTYPYGEDYFFSYERQLPGQTVLSISYVGSEAHHLLSVYSADPGNAQLCLDLNAAGYPCGPGDEANTWTIGPSGFQSGGVNYAPGTVILGTRGGLNPSLVTTNSDLLTSGANYYGNDDYDASIGNSHYNSLQISVRNSAKFITYSLGYTYSRSIDQASSISDTLDPYNFNATRGLSAWNLTDDFVATYDIRLPLERLSNRAHRVLQGWEISGITRASTGFPVTLSVLNGDNSLQGSSPNGVNNRYIDMPDLTSQPLNITNPHKTPNLQYFNPGAFTQNAEGTVGNAGRRTFSGPGEFVTDLVLRRNFQIRESQVLQIRLEAFNVFNTTNFFGPAAINGVQGDPLFGQAINAAPPRLIQIAAKYTF